MNNGVLQPVSRQRIGKHVPATTNTHTTIQLLLQTVFSALPVQVVVRKTVGATQLHPYGGRFEYLHRGPASRRRRRKGKS
jgi:hypothetical protein